MGESLGFEDEEAAILQAKVSGLKEKLEQFKLTADDTASETSQIVSEHFNRLLSTQGPTVNRSELT
jgi:hypothetical protein